MQVLIPALLLCAILALLSQFPQDACRRFVRARRERVFAAPLALSALFCALLWVYGAGSASLVALIVIYTFAPTLLA